MPDAAAWIDALNSIPGFGDAWVSNATLGGATATDAYYTVAATVQVRSSAFAHRFEQTTTGGTH